MALDRALDGDAARRNIDRPARIFVPILEHIPAEQDDFDPLMPAALKRLDVDEWRCPGDHLRSLLKSAARGAKAAKKDNKIRRVKARLLLTTGYTIQDCPSVIENA
jgi:hypothetical protein